MKLGLSIALTAAILLGGGGAAYALHGQWNDPVVKGASLLGKPGEAQDALQTPKDLKAWIKEDQQKVVAIEATFEDGVATGSGFLYNDKGDIVTNAHVVSGATHIAVKGYDTSLHQGKLIGISVEKDLALIRVADMSGREPLEADISYKAETGDEVIAFGSPLGLDNTVTTGIVSGVDRDLEVEETSYTGLYQISAPITHGNSGGPLVLRANGKVIGINTAASSEGTIGFSIPIRQAVDLIDKWSAHPDEQLVKESTSGEAGGASGYTKEAMATEAEYLLEDFYDSIAQQDFVTAYSLLGSDWQSKTSYEAFRKGYLNTVDVAIQKLEATSSTTESAVVAVMLEATEDVGGDEYRSSTYNSTYQVGLENGILKILSGKGKKVK